eukprot:CAMPEP_0171095908 /NCGR_PEP_ID=MMETSP0766_2-20121228/43441_1 /TAXON_ID=439317 /ORGANISM="Gambierdiscus australes, Strain CAWD 149" /LENGTH=146 /DNA_ID=CAMNT_0011554777 /DNA_START=51 /DNA_END=491 /DNA_ORIENTATION=+
MHSAMALATLALLAAAGQPGLLAATVQAEVLALDGGASMMQAPLKVATAVLISDDRQRCLEGPVDYMRRKASEIKDSFLAPDFTQNLISDGTCAGSGFASGPQKSPCLKRASLYTLRGVVPKSNLYHDYWAQHGFMAAVSFHKFCN